jgi:hypothetical protein
VEIKHVYVTKDHAPRSGAKASNDIVLDSLVVSGSHCVFELRAWPTCSSKTCR